MEMGWKQDKIEENLKDCAVMLYDVITPEHAKKIFRYVKDHLQTEEKEMIAADIENNRKTAVLERLIWYLPRRLKDITMFVDILCYPEFGGRYLKMAERLLQGLSQKEKDEILKFSAPQQVTETLVMEEEPDERVPVESSAPGSLHLPHECSRESGSGNPSARSGSSVDLTILQRRGEITRDAAPEMPEECLFCVSGGDMKPHHNHHHAEEEENLTEEESRPVQPV